MCMFRAVVVNETYYYLMVCMFRAVVKFGFLIDINECLGKHGCEKKCINTIGSFRCNCEVGYKYSTVDGGMLW